MSIMQLTQTIHLLPPVQYKGKAPVQPMLPGLESEESIHPIVTNRQIAEVLSGIAALLEAQHSNPYRIQAYRNAARGVLDLSEPVANLIERGESLPVPGLGERLRARIFELVQTGTMTFYNDLSMPLLPEGVRKLMRIEHVGLYTALRLYEELGIDTPEKLWWAAQQHRIRNLSGFGPRSEIRLKESVDRLLHRNRGTHDTADTTEAELHGAA